MAINILIVDDDKEMMETLVKNLERADVKKKLGVCVVDDSFLDDSSLENYDPLKHGINFDIVLVDYQLSSAYTGVLAAAWIAIKLKTPKVTLTGGKYSGPTACFDGFFEKKELLDNPESVIERLESIVNNFNSRQWLEEQHNHLVEEYHGLLDEKRKLESSFSKEKELSMIEGLLDKFDKIIDEEQNRTIKERLALLGEKSEFSKQNEEHIKRLSEMDAQLNACLKELETYND